MSNSHFDLKPKEAIVWKVIDEYTNKLPDKYQVFEPKEILNYNGDYLRKALDVEKNKNPDLGVRNVIRDLSKAEKLLIKISTGKFRVVKRD